MGIFPRRTGIVVAAAVAVWALWCIIESAPALSWWAYAYHDWTFATRSHGLHPSALAWFWLKRAASLLPLIPVFLAMLKAGLPFVGLLNVNSRNVWMRLSLAVLLGTALMGAAFMAVALLGLFARATIYLLCLLILAAPAPPGAWPKTRAWDLPLLSRSHWPLAPAILTLAVTFMFMFLPDTNGDAYGYHLAFSQKLLRMHRLTAEGITIPLACSLTMEHIYSIPVSLGLDELSHFVNCIPFVAAMFLLLRWTARQGGFSAALIAAAGIVTFGQVNRMMLLAKSDIPAAAYPVAGMVCAFEGLRRRSFPLQAGGALLLGCGAVVKYSCLPLMVLGLAWIVAARVRRRADLGKTVLLPAVASIPLLAWFAKTWLMTGDPAWPLFSAFIPGSLWDARCTTALKLALAHVVPEHSILAMPLVLIRVMIDHQPALAAAAPLLLLPAIALGSQVRWLASYAIAGIGILWILVPLEDMRYALPLFLLLVACASVAIALQVQRLPRKLRGALAAVGAASTLIPLGALVSVCVFPPLVFPYLTANIERKAYLTVYLTTYWFTAQGMKAAGVNGKAIGIAESRSYHLPVSLVWDRCYERNWAWVFSHECFTADEIAKKMRQTGCRAILCNYYFELNPSPAAAAFPWDDRMIALWKDFVGRHLDLSPAVNPAPGSMHGGFRLYVLRSRPRTEAPKRVLYLPGIAGLYLPVVSSLDRDESPEALRRALDLAERVPGVDDIDNLVARAYARQGQLVKAMKYYRPAPEHGGTDAELVWGEEIPRLKRFSDARR